MFRKVLLLLFLINIPLLAQEEERGAYFFDAHYFHGSILRHNKDISHLIINHPQGFIAGFNNKTYGKERWQQAYNFPDWGISAVYFDPGNEVLGQNIGIYGHFNFYFFRRKLVFRVAQGIAYTTNPFDLQTNFKNNAYGTSLLSSTYALLNYSKPDLFRNIGLQAGIAFIHYSNANFKAPNSSINTLALNLGLQYHLSEKSREFITEKDTLRFEEPIHFNVMLRGGVNESDYLNLGQHPFLAVSVFADKRLSFKSKITAGAEVFFSEFLKKEIEYVSISFPGSGLTGKEDYKRIGVFLGHELNFDRLALITQVGYYIYYPYDFEGRLYQRIGLAYYFKGGIFLSATLKTHGAKAEALEFGIGLRI